MTKKPSIQTEIVTEYLEKFPDVPNKTLARKIYNENKLVFTSLDSARSKVRYIVGNQGEKSRKNNTHLNKKPAENCIKMNIGNPYHLPESFTEPWEPFDLPQNKLYGLLSDIHIPYHDIKALTESINELKQLGIEALILNGDTLDFYQLSRFIKDPRKRRFHEELESARQLLESLKNVFPGPLYWKMGNHEERYENWLKIKAPELLDIQEFRLENLLRFGEYGITLVEDQRIIKAGKLNIAHGHEFGRSVFSPVNPSRGYYNKSKTNTIAGHLHQTSEHTEKDLNNKMVSVWSVGCLCDLHPEYARVNKWNHGFAAIDLKEDGAFNVSNYRIYNGKIV